MPRRNNNTDREKATAEVVTSGSDSGCWCDSQQLWFGDVIDSHTAGEPRRKPQDSGVMQFIRIKWTYSVREGMVPNKAPRRRDGSWKHRTFFSALCALGRASEVRDLSPESSGTPHNEGNADVPADDGGDEIGN